MKDKLTPRERELIALAAKGYDTPAIADELHISYGTVSSAFHRILNKLKSTTRAQAVVLAIARGDIQVGPDGSLFTHFYYCINCDNHENDWQSAWGSDGSRYTVRQCIKLFHPYNMFVKLCERHYAIPVRNRLD